MSEQALVENTGTNVATMPAVKTDETPQGIAPMVQMVASGQITIDQLDRLMSLQERHEEGLAKRAYNAAMAEFRSVVPAALKDGKGQNGKYATFGSVMAAINGPLGDHGFNVDFKHNQADDSPILKVICTITHSSGHSESASLQVPVEKLGSANGVQSLGGTVSYLKRYTVSSLTALATEDDDGQSFTTVKETLISASDWSAMAKKVKSSGGNAQKWEALIREKYKTQSEIPAVPKAEMGSLLREIDGAAAKREKKAAQETAEASPE